MRERFVCVHGHFYQPPRENPWLEAVEIQESAHPDHDWNARITRECYAPNARSRILDGEGWIADLVSNYARMSFNFGPTLLAWLEAEAPAVYGAILEADRRSAERFGGHGSALAQGYNHAILPLCNDRDLRTQVLWGLADFEKRFGRKAEGMWLPETAASTRTLEALAEAGVRFTILAPRQAAATRRIGSGEWEECGGAVDPSMPYACKLPSGREIALFFYDGPISQGVAFEGLLHSGEVFAARLMEAFDERRDWPQLAHIATDGESYGHHHRHGEMALADALRRIEEMEGVRLTNYGEHLARFTPTHEARIVEDSSWSCVHGVERWKSDCGCNSGGRAGWRQRWRGPVRGALDWLRDTVAEGYEREGKALMEDPWGARDGYIAVALDRSEGSVGAFFERHGRPGLSPESRIRALMLLEMQRHAMLMYTSCGWFFDDVGGIETAQVLQYAGRVAQLARETLGFDPEPGFVERLAEAPGNTPESRDGRMVYERAVRPAVVDLKRVAAHHAISALFRAEERVSRVYCFEVEALAGKRMTAGRARMGVGRSRFRSVITGENEEFTWAAVHLGDHTVNCGVRSFRGESAYAELESEMTAVFDRADFAEALRVVDRRFEGGAYSIASLFRDQQHAVIREILKPTLEQIDASYRQIYEQNAPLARFLRGLNLPTPRRMRLPANFVLNQAIRKEFESASPGVGRVRELVAEAASQGVALDGETLAYALQGALARAMSALGTNGEDVTRLTEALELVRLAIELPFEVDLWRAQETMHDLLRVSRGRMAERADRGDESARRWLALAAEVAGALRVRGA